VTDPATILERGWIFRVLPARTRPVRLALLFIHGWTGDERSMEVFARNRPPDAVALLPRGPVQAPNGYGWAPAQAQGWPSLDAFATTASALMAEIELRLRDQGAAGLPLCLAGFSQGAAMCHALTLLFPQRVERIAALSGFLPYPSQGLPSSSLAGKRYFLSHGLQDETIPVQIAEENVAWLRQAGAHVETCWSNTGHKMALDCLKRLQTFLYD
jgi:phospholipase/carboxylesterase